MRPATTLGTRHATCDIRYSFAPRIEHTAVEIVSSTVIETQSLEPQETKQQKAAIEQRGATVRAGAPSCARD